MQRILEGDADGHLQVGAALGRLPAAAARGAPEQVREDVAEVAHLELSVALREDARVEPLGAALSGAEAAARAEGAQPAHLVVLLALLEIGERLVGDADLLEALLSLLVAGVLVRVVLARQLAERLLHLVLGGALGHA